MKKDNRCRWKNCSLLTYTLIIYLVALSIVLTSFTFFWSSDTRQLAVDIQRATSQEPPGPFLEERPDLPLLGNGILELDEWRQIKLQFQQVLEPLDPGQDWRLEDETAIEALLEP